MARRHCGGQRLVLAVAQVGAAALAESRRGDGAGLPPAFRELGTQSHGRPARHSHCGVRGRAHKDLTGIPMSPGTDRNRAWIVVVLLFMFMVINFADKAAIGIAAVPIMQELQLGPRQFGLVGSSSSCYSRSRRSRPGFLSTGCRRAGCCLRWA